MQRSVSDGGTGGLDPLLPLSWWHSCTLLLYCPSGGGTNVPRVIHNGALMCLASPFMVVLIYSHRASAPVVALVNILCLPMIVALM